MVVLSLPTVNVTRNLLLLHVQFHFFLDWHSAVVYVSGISLFILLCLSAYFFSVARKLEASKVVNAAVIRL